MDPQLALRQQLYGLLGDLPPRDRPLAARVVAQERRQEYVVERLLLDLNGIEDVPAVFVCPLPDDGHPVTRYPAVLYNHAHGQNYELGKEELLVGRAALQPPPYAVRLARRGCCALCIDHWAFGERRGRSEAEIFRAMLWQGQVLWGMMIYDSLRALDYLLARPDVDPGRVATLGISMGSTLAWWLAALDTRLKVCVDLCCMTDFAALAARGGLEGHGLYYYVPGLLKHFDTAAINALIAPRPHLSLNGNYDPLTPPEGLDRIDSALQRVYGAAGVPAAWRMVRSDTGHFETLAFSQAIGAFLEEWL